MARWLALVLALVVAWPAVASAQEIGAAATGLASNPLYVDPSLRSAFTDAERAALEARLAEQTSPPVLVALVPLVSGDSVDGKPRSLLTVLRRRTGRDDAIFVTAANGSLTADQPDENDERVRAASSWTNLSEHDYDERVATTLNRYLDALADPDILEKAEEAREDLSDRVEDSRPSVPAAGPTGSDGGFPTALAVLIAAALLCGGTLLVVARRRGARPALSGPLTLPDHVFEAAHGARRNELRKTVERELVDLAAQLDAEPVPSDPRAQEHYQRALDARDTAGRLLADADATDADLVGALVLEDLAQRALGAARGARPTDAAPLCALNPTHGRSVATGRWGSSPPLPVCRECHRDLRAKRAPEVLDDGGRPYLERDTVWARTAFGALVGDLNAEVVRERVER